MVRVHWPSYVRCRPSYQYGTNLARYALAIKTEGTHFHAHVRTCLRACPRTCLCRHTPIGMRIRKSLHMSIGLGRLAALFVSRIPTIVPSMTGTPRCRYRHACTQHVRAPWRTRTSARGVATASRHGTFARRDHQGRRAYARTRARAHAHCTRRRRRRRVWGSRASPMPYDRICAHALRALLIRAWRLPFQSGHARLIPTPPFPTLPAERA